MPMCLSICRIHIFKCSNSSVGMELTSNSQTGVAIPQNYNIWPHGEWIVTLPANAQNGSWHSPAPSQKTPPMPKWETAWCEYTSTKKGQNGNTRNLPRLGSAISKLDIQPQEARPSVEEGHYRMKSKKLFQHAMIDVANKQVVEGHNQKTPSSMPWIWKNRPAKHCDAGV